ncbi:MAG: TlpA disulfide reductase family protein [Azonexus sp.]
MKKILASLLLATLNSLASAAQPASEALFASTLTDLNDKPVALERYRGKPLVVNFWARWCAPCRQEIPELASFAKTHKGKIEVLGIGIEDKAEPVREFADKYKMNYTVLIAGDKGIPLMQNLGNNVGGLPFTLFIDRSGKVVDRKVGILKKADLDAAAPQLLKN